MKLLRDREEIARAINGRKMPVVEIDLSKADCYGIISEPVVINNGHFRDGFPYMIHAHVRCYRDEKRFTFSAGGVGISADFGYSDVEEMLEYRNAPVINTDEDVVLVIKNPKERYCWIIIMHTADHITQHCSTPLAFTDNDILLNAILLQETEKEE